MQCSLLIVLIINMSCAILLSKDWSVLQKVILEIKQGDWNTQQNCIKITSKICVKKFIWKRYNKLYSERIYLNLSKKTLEVATKWCS